MRIPPLEVLAQWPTPNYENPETRGPAGDIVGIVFGALALLVVSIRLYTRKYISNGLGLDDALIVLAFVRTRFPVR